MQNSMTTGCEAELWRKIEAFELDDPQSDYPFSARLAHENGWTRAFALRAIREYKRFVFLCITSAEPPCPSEQVDEVWHLHLTFTRSYWTDFCAGVLGRPLHHNPTRGGRDEHVKHVRMYEQTLADYHAKFQCEPPAEIWPPASVRFGSDTQHRKVNLSRNWVIPNPLARLMAQLRRRRTKISLVAAVAILPIFAAIPNPLDLTGPQFLTLYFSCLAVAVVVGWIARRTLLPASKNDLRSPMSPLADSSPLSPVEIAQLARGKRGAIATVACQLMADDVLRIRKDETTLLGMSISSTSKIVAGEGKLSPEAWENRVATLLLNEEQVTPQKIDTAVGDALDRVEAGLVNRGLVYEPHETFPARFVPAGIVGLVFALGAAKLVVGLMRDKPVGFLAIALGLTGIAIYFFVRNIRRSRAGDELIKRLTAENAALKSLATQSGTLSPATGAVSSDLAFAVALFGTTALVGTAFGGLSSWERHAFGNVSSDVSSGCSSGCSGGSGCGGGGGCGGSGCGGCGGD